MIKLCLFTIVAAALAGCASHHDCCREAGESDPKRPLPEGAVIQYVRLESGLAPEEAMAMLRQREPQFREVPGLVQKIYGKDRQTGEICGIYIFESESALDAFRQSDLARTIPQAYQAKSVRVERYDVLFTLYPGVRD